MRPRRHPSVPNSTWPWGIDPGFRMRLFPPLFALGDKIHSFADLPKANVTVEIASHFSKKRLANIHLRGTCHHRNTVCIPAEVGTSHCWGGGGWQCPEPPLCTWFWLQHFILENRQEKGSNGRNSTGEHLTGETQTPGLHTVSWRGGIGYG